MSSTKLVVLAISLVCSLLASGILLLGTPYGYLGWIAIGCAGVITSIVLCVTLATLYANGVKKRGGD